MATKKFLLGWTALSFGLPIITLTTRDEKYAKRRDESPETTTMLPNAPSGNVEDSLNSWLKSGAVNENEALALKTALASYNLQVQPRGHDLWKGYAEDAILECPMFIYAGRDRIGRAWRGVKTGLDIKGTVKSVSKTKMSSSSNTNSVFFV